MNKNRCRLREPPLLSSSQRGTPTADDPCAVPALLVVPHPPLREPPKTRSSFSGNPFVHPQTPASPRISGLFYRGLQNVGRGLAPAVFFGWVRYAIPVRLIHRFPRTHKNSYLVFGKPRRSPHSPKEEGFQFRPARRPICDGGEQGVWGWRGVSRAVRGG